LLPCFSRRFFPPVKQLASIVSGSFSVVAFFCSSPGFRFLQLLCYPSFFRCTRLKNLFLGPFLLIFVQRFAPPLPSRFLWMREFDPLRVKVCSPPLGVTHGQIADFFNPLPLRCVRDINLSVISLRYPSRLAPAGSDKNPATLFEEFGFSPLFTSKSQISSFQFPSLQTILLFIKTPPPRHRSPAFTTCQFPPDFWSYVLSLPNILLPKVTLELFRRGRKSIPVAPFFCCRCFSFSMKDLVTPRAHGLTASSLVEPFRRSCSFQPHTRSKASFLL